MNNREESETKKPNPETFPGCGFLESDPSGWENFFGIQPGLDIISIVQARSETSLSKVVWKPAMFLFPFFL